MDPSLITTVIPFKRVHFVAVNEKIRALSAKPEVTKRLDEGEFVHFLSIVAVGVACPSENWEASQGDENALRAWSRARQRASQGSIDDKAHVLVEIAADGGVEQATAQLVKAFGREIAEVLQTADVWPTEKETKKKQTNDAQRTEAERAEAERIEEEKLKSFLLKYQCPIRAGWTLANWLRKRGRRSRLGQTHIGAPGMTVWRIRHEAELAQWIDRRLQKLRAHKCWIDASPIQRLDMIRALVWRGRSTNGGDAKWAFSAESAPCLEADPANHWNDSGYDARNPQALRALADVIQGLAWPFYAPLALALVGLAWVWAGSKPVDLPTPTLIGSAVLWAAVALFLCVLRGRAWRVSSAVVAAVVLLWLGCIWHESREVFDLIVFALPKSLAALFVAVAAVVLVLYRRLLRLEINDPVETLVPPPEQIQALMNQENRAARVQNHMATVSRLKPGLLRRLTLRLAFLVVGTGHYVGRPGFLGKNGVIHVARWMRLPGTSLLMFWSNFDGTWESYVADFIADAPTGVTAIWSNCVGFPRTKGLFSEGAEDRNQLVNWARRQQQPTLFWYSAYPKLTTDRIRTNAAIRQGLASAASDDDARDWLSLFGSSQRPPDSLDATEIPTLIFGGLSARPAACMLLIRLSDNADEARKWLGGIEEDVTFGEARPGLPACVLGLAASALRKLQLPDAALATFPTAFQQGMWPEWRARALGDIDDIAPTQWVWGGTSATQLDAVVILYAYVLDESDDKSLPRLVERLETASRNYGACVFRKIDLDPPISGPAGTTNGSFGFTDGISQPVIRGAPRGGRNAVPTDLVSPGELVLGYPDNTGRLPPSPCLMAKHDPKHYLPNAGTDPFRRRPEFSRYEPQTGARDIGTNGTFLVVRQLQEEDGAFEKWYCETYDAMNKELDIDFTADTKDAVVQARDDPPSSDSGANPEAENNKKRLIASLLVGRWPNGSSLVRNPRSPARGNSFAVRPDNTFRYGLEDPRGFACPFGAHTRRANPRDTRFHANLAESDTEIAAVNRHRILRVGRAYGNSTASQSGRGLMFMCINADIERQFEFVQKTWLLNPNFHGLQGETDPLLSRGKGRTFTVPSPAGPVTLPLENFVKMVGGGYFFLPGRATLRYLATTNSSK